MGGVDPALGGRCAGRPCSHRRGLAAARGALSVGMSARSRASRSDPRTRPRCARRRHAASGGHFAHGPRARRGRPVEAARRVARGSGRVDCERRAPRRARPRMRPCRPPRCVGRPAATPGGRALLAAPAGSLLDGQLTRAREEVCDNHVLRCGDRSRLRPHAAGLDRTVSALRRGAPGLGLLGARWTLADRVAGLLDPRRIPMTRTTIRMKIALAVVLAVTGLAGCVRPARPSGAGRRTDRQSGSIRKPPLPANRRTRSGVSRGSSSMNRANPFPVPSSTRGRRPIRRAQDGRRWHVHALGWTRRTCIPASWSPKPTAAHGSAWSDLTRRVISRRRIRCGSS